MDHYLIRFIYRISIISKMSAIELELLRSRFYRLDLIFLMQYLKVVIQGFTLVETLIR